MTLNSIHTKSIPNGTKFVAIYADGSGAHLFKIDKTGKLYCPEGEMLSNAPDTHLMDCDYYYWIELPKTFKLWFEQKNGK